MAEVAPEELAEHVKRLLGVTPKFVGLERVNEQFGEQTAWEGTVSVFSIDHPEADTCYAWSSPIEGSERRKFYAVLKVPPVDSPEAAVRAAIVSDYRGED